MKTTPARSRRRSAGYSLPEMLITATLVALVGGLALGVFLNGLRAMYKDTQRLTTNATLRNFTAQVAKETLDSTEFYVFPTYEKLDGSVDLANDVSPLETDAYGTEVAYGDCLVLVTRVTVEDISNVRQFRIYYRVTTQPNNDGAIRYYESQDYGASGTTTALATLLNGVNLRTTPLYPTSRQLAATARGRSRPSLASIYPIFSTEAATTTPTNESVSINVEIINGSSVTNTLSSSSFNYTISPRR